MTPPRWLRNTAAALTLVLLAGCSTSYDTDVDQAAVEYDGYHFIKTDKKFVDCIKPAQEGRDGHGTHFYYYPVGQSTYKFASGSIDSEPISVVSKDNVTMYVTGVATFSLNSNCDVLRQFHERIGNRYMDVVDDDGHRTDNWRSMLATYVGQPVDKSLDTASKAYTYQQLYSDPDVKEQWEKQVGQLIASNVKEQTGNDYFCQPDFTGDGDCGVMTITLQAPVPPQNLRDALTAKQQSILENEAQTEKNVTALTESEGIRKSMKELGLSGEDGFAQYLVLLAIQKGVLAYIPIKGAATNVTLPAASPAN